MPGWGCNAADVVKFGNDRVYQQWVSSLPAAVLHDQDELVRRFAGSQQLQDVGVVWQV